MIEKLESKIEKKILRGNMIPLRVNMYAMFAKRQIMRKYRRMALLVSGFSGAEYEEFITRIDAIIANYIRMNIVLIQK